MLVTPSVVRSSSRSIPPFPASKPTPSIGAATPPARLRASKPAASVWAAATPPAQLGACTPAPGWIPALKLPHSTPAVFSSDAARASAAQQQQGVWKEIERTRYAHLPDAPAIMGATSWLHSVEHPPMARLGRAVASTLGLPFDLFNIGKYYGGTLIGMAAGLFGMGWAPVVAAYLTAQQVQQVTRTPRVMTATADFVPQENTPFSGMFKTGAKAMVSLVAGRFGPHIRVDLFVDGHAPLVLRSNTGWTRGVTTALAERTCEGKAEATPSAPDSLELEFRTWPHWEADEDWRTVITKRFPEGSLLYQVMGADPNTHQPVSLGQLRLTSRFAASGFGDVHLQ